MKMNLDELKQMGILKSRCNVGIPPEQYLLIKSQVDTGKFKSINKFVAIAIENELKRLAGEEKK